MMFPVSGKVIQKENLEKASHWVKTSQVSEQVFKDEI